MRGILAAAVAVTAAALLPVAPASADDTIAGCESVPMLGFDPHLLRICDTPRLPDGSWGRWRQEWRQVKFHSSCGGIYYPTGSPFCPPWLQDVIPGGFSDGFVSTVTDDTVPPGEPGHLDNAVRCPPTIPRCS